MSIHVVNTESTSVGSEHGPSVWCNVVTETVHSQSLIKNWAGFLNWSTLSSGSSSTHLTPFSPNSRWIDGDNDEHVSPEWKEPLSVGPLQEQQTVLSGSERFLRHQNEAGLCFYISAFPVSVEQHVTESSLSKSEGARWKQNVVRVRLCYLWLFPGWVQVWCDGNLPVSMCRPSVCFSFSRFAPV